MPRAGGVTAVLSALLLVPASGPLPGQQAGAGSFVHESWTVENGLPLNSIRQVHQSRDGYIWIATLDGLARFDGVRFTVYNSANSPALPTNRIVRLYETRDGTLWLQTERSQLVRFRHGKFTHIDAAHGVRTGVTLLYEDSEGVVWVGTLQGVGRMDGDRFVPVAADSIRGWVQTIVQRSDRSLWIMVEGQGLLRLEGDRVEKVLNSAALDTTAHRWMGEDAGGRLWLSTMAGAWTSDSTSARSTTAFVPRPPRALVIAGGQVKLLDNKLSHLRLEDRVGMPGRLAPDGRLWFIDGSRLYNEAGLAWDMSPADRPLDASARLTSVTVDREGSIWLGTFNMGLHRLKPALFRTFSAAEGLPHRNTSTILEDGDGVIWIGTRRGLSRIDGGGDVRSWSSLGGTSSDVLTMFSDSPRQLWVGTGTGLLSCTLPAMACRGTGIGPTQEGVQALFRDSRGRLWVGTASGAALLTNGEWRRTPDSLGTVSVRAFAETGDGALWMGTNGRGLLRYHDGGFSFIGRAAGLPSDLIRSLHIDRDGWLWIGTEGRGLARLDPRSWQGRAQGRINHVGPERGLYDGVIHQILVDDSDRFWMSGNRGIFWVTRTELQAVADGRAAQVHSTSYTERDGIRNREANGGSQPAGIRSRDGRLWFPTQDGVTVVDPARVTESLMPPVIIESITAGQSTYNATDIPAQLGVNQRSLSIEYTAPAFLTPQNIRFRYRLDPYDADWIEAGSRRTAFYTGLPPGRYTFRVIASNLGDVWNEAGNPLRLDLGPRFHETGTARLLLGLALLGLTVGIFRWRMSDLRRRERELTRIVDERTAALRHNELALAAQNTRLAEMDQAKSRLFANLSHEFRTPLTLILGPIRSILDGRHGPVSGAVREQADLMLRNGQRLLRLINQVLDLTKLQAGQMKLDFHLDDLAAFARRVTLAFMPLAERRQITLRFHSAEQRVPVRFDAEQLEKVLLNLLSNAVKFTESGGTVEVTLSVNSNLAVLSVGDSGVGIRSEELTRIFERFYQADTSTTRRYEGTGIGLSLARELVELHGGKITAESTPGAGSTFTVSLPLDTSNHLSTTDSQDGPGGELAAVDVLLSVSAEHPSENGSGPERGDRTTILVVDDNADVRAYIRSVLSASYEILDAANGAAGLERARADLPDLIVADVMMPELDGLAMGRALKDDPMTDAIPLVLLTARAASEDQVAGLETGADAYVIKPFDPDVLEAQVANLLAQRRRLRERFRSGQESPPAPLAEARSELEQKLRPLVEAHLTDPDFGPNEFAEAAALTYNQLYYALHEQLQTTPSRFIRTRRVECAALLLRQGAGRVTEVAYSVGFESLSYFNRAFKERFGSSPTAYIARSTAR